jgi:hypothetical protein
MKELGFDEPCLGLYHNDKTFYPTQCKSHEEYHGQVYSAPLYQQAFRFFREKYNLVSIIFNDDGDIEYDNLRYNWEIRVVTYSFKNMKNEKNACVGTYFYKTYKEAELKCLKKLIKICKTK